jgi:phosphate-selective porin OprO/OprP
MTIRILSALGFCLVISNHVAAQAPAATPAPAAPAPAIAPAAPAAPAAAPAPPIVAEAPPEAIAGAEPEPEEAPAKVGYEKGFFIESGDGDFRLAIGARVQVRYAYTGVESGTDTSAFSIERARLKLDGHAFTKDLTYVFQSDFGKGVTSLKDFYADYRLAPEWLHLRAGQWKRPFSRQQITSSGSLALVDRAITDRAYGTGRDIGIAVHNNYEKSPSFEYAIGLFNGTGERARSSAETTIEVDPATGDITASTTASDPSNVPDMLHPALVGRVGYNHGGLKGYSEVDLEGGDLRFGVGASGQVDFDADRDDDSVVKAELDAIVKVHGFDATGAVYISSVQTAEDFSDRGLGALGFHLQAGYLFASEYQVAARFAVVAPEGAKNDDSELALVLGYLPFGHNLKWQTDLAGLTHQSSHTTDVRLRSQLQFAF